MLSIYRYALDPKSSFKGLLLLWLEEELEELLLEELEDGVKGKAKKSWKLAGRFQFIVFVVYPGIFS